ncbi:response regulator [Oscillatoria sp. CS-180]|uniref:response regulator n=1 Tax=Oscillatoria sp. CS-180 TaxID=3021720 RepID=UPI002330E7FD|nr:response regulator [Oscillatoria sp. CS-180]MDB9524603.1 response regulator [Oscillatoria sp. CS-180]
MNDANELLMFSETLLFDKTGACFTELQRQILLAALQGTRKTYEQIAVEFGYSSKYVKQGVAPKLWRLLSDALGQKVTKSNVRFLLEKERQSLASILPVLANDNPSSPDEMPSEIPRTAFPLGNINPPTSGSILLVDDQPQNLRVLSDLLEEEGYRVRQAISGEIALDAIAEEKPVLVLLDIHMPEMDGYSVCQQIKSNPATQDIAVIFVSALDETWDKVKAFSVGGNDYVNKPFKVVEVLVRVENQLKVTQLQQQLADQNEQLRQALRREQQLAEIDAATQVASRRRFDQFLLESWQQALKAQEPLTLMLCQVDHFSLISKESTPRWIDSLLYSVAQTLKSVSGLDALVCRYSLITFSIVLPQQTLTVAETIAQKVLEQVQGLSKKQALARSGVSYPSVVTLSVGLVTACPTPDMDMEEQLLELCEKRLQQAKNQGGNCWISS